MAESPLCCLEARRERAWDLGGTALSLSCTDPWAAPEGSSVYVRGCHLNDSAFMAKPRCICHGICLLPKWRLCWGQTLAGWPLHSLELCGY